eukprot:5429164-Pyramimonas_sp.AAC.1
MYSSIRNAAQRRSGGTPVRVAVRPNNLRNSGQFGTGLQRQSHNDSLSSSVQLMPPLESENSSEVYRHVFHSPLSIEEVQQA